MDRQFLEQLQCSCCGRKLSLAAGQVDGEGGVDSGLLACECYRYPIAGGVALLRQAMPDVACHVNQVASAIENGQAGFSLDLALQLTYRRFCRSTRRQRLAGRVADLAQRYLARSERRRTGRLVRDERLTYRQALAELRPATYAQYLYHRYANPSFLSAVASILLLHLLKAPADGRPMRVLDLACGSGHASFLIQRLFPNVQVVAADFDFLGLYLSRRFVAPSAEYVCLDAEMPLPFADGSFHAAICLDAVPYIRCKRLLAGELNRVVAAGGLVLLPHLHSAKGRNFAQGQALSPRGYLDCFRQCGLPARAFTDSAMLRGLTQEDCLDLRGESPPEELDSDDALWLAASHSGDIWQKHEGVCGLLCREPHRLGLNPIYKPQVEGGQVSLEMRWPSPRLQAECGVVDQYSPCRCTMSRGLWDSLQAGRPDGPQEEIRRLARQFVLVHLPDGY